MNVPHRPVLLSAVMGVALVLSAPAARAGDDPDELQLRMSDQWQAVRDDRVHGIRAWGRIEPGKRFRSFRVESVLRGSAGALVTRLRDAALYPRWYWSTREATPVRTVSPDEFYLHLVHDAPYAMPDRDVVLHARLREEDGGGELLLESAPDVIPPSPPLIRMPAENIRLTWMPAGPGRLKIIAEGYADPGGKVPFWAVNFAQRSAPYQIILRLSQLAEDDPVPSAPEP